MIWERTYAVFWLVYCGYETYRLLKRSSEGTEDDETNARIEEFLRVMDMGKAVISPIGIMGLIYALLIILIMIDVMGLMLAYSCPPLRIYELCFLGAVSLAVLHDHTKSFRFFSKNIKRAVCSDKPLPVLVRYLEIMKPPRTWIRYVATYGRFIVSFYLALWAMY